MTIWKTEKFKGKLSELNDYTILQSFLGNDIDNTMLRTDVVYNPYNAKYRYIVYYTKHRTMEGLINTDYSKVKYTSHTNFKDAYLAALNYLTTGLILGAIVRVEEDNFML